VCIRTGRNQNRLDGGVRKELVVILLHAGDSQILRHCLRHFQADIANGCQICLGYVAHQVGNMNAAHPPCTNDGNIHFLIHMKNLLPFT